jgi:hypothetical protein
MRSGATPASKCVPSIVEVVSGPRKGAGVNVGKQCFQVRYSDAPAELIWEPADNISCFPGGTETLQAYMNLKRQVKVKQG